MSPIQAVDLRVRQNASRTKILSELDEQIDFFHYIMEILRLGIGELNQVLVDQLLAHFIVPVLLGSFLPVSPTHTPLVAKSLALHILTQVFLIFTDRPLVNSILTCLLHDHPPAVTLELFTRAPQHPVFDSVALSEVMYISVKESYDRIERGKKCNNTPTFDDDDDDDDDDDEDTLNSNRAHSHRVPPSGVGPLFQPSECMENWSASATSNPCRQAFLSFLDSDNDRVAFGASSVLLAIIKNSEIDSLLLERIRLCPQRISKRRKLLNNILCESSSANIPHHMESTIHDTSFDEDDDSEDNECIENQSLTHHQIDEEDCDLVNHEQSEFDHDDAKSNGTCIDNDQTRYETRCDSSSSPSSAAATTAAAAGTLSPSSALVASDLSPSSSSPPSSAAASSTAAAAVTAAPETNTDPTYDDELFNILIGVLDCQHYRSTSLLSLVSQLLVELFCVDASSIVSDTTSVTHNNTSLSHSTQSCLKASHSALLDAKRRDAEDQVRQCQAYSEFIAASEEMSVGAFGSLFLDVFEKLFLTSFPSSTKLLSLIADGNSLFIDCNIVFDTEDIANTLALQATAPLAMCFSLRRLALKAEQRCDDMFPVQQPHSYTMKKNQIITLVNREVLPCIAQFGSIRERKLLLLDDEFLLLADAMPHTTKERRAIIFAAILLRHVEIHSAIGVTKMTLNISCRGIGAMTPPHSHCHHHHHHTSKTETASTIYIFALQFDSVDNAEMAFNTLNRFRSRRRLQVLSQIQLFLRSEEAYKTTHIDTNA